MCELTTPLVFHNVTLCTCDFARARIPPFIGKYVKTLTLLAIDHEKLSFQEWDDRMWEKNDGDYRSDLDENSLLYDDRHAKQAFGIYEKSHQDIRMASGLCMARLQSSLRWMQRLRKVVVTDTVYQFVTRRYDNCALTDCKFKDDDHTIFGLPPISGLPKLGPMILEFLLSGLARCQCPMKKLVIQGCERTSALGYESLVYTSPQGLLRLQSIGSMLSKLTKLTMVLETDDFMTAARFQRSGTEMAPIAHTLSHARNLRFLKLGTAPDNAEGHHISDRPFANIRVVLLGCVFSKLTTILLEGFEATVTDLLNFTDGSPCLVNLSIWSTCLTSGTWADALDRWKKSLVCLKHVDLNWLIGSMGPDSQTIWLSDWFRDRYVEERADGGYMNRNGRIQDFFFNGGINPFSVEGLRYDYGYYPALIRVHGTVLDQVPWWLEGRVDIPRTIWENTEDPLTR
ncbi:MAG: hypothetical protein Q9209_005008 [Squamulea sp. 1 TL-2023]